MLCLACALWHQTGVILGMVFPLIPAQACGPPNCWLSQASSMSRPHGVSLMVFIGLLLTLDRLSGPCEGHLSQIHSYSGPTILGRGSSCHHGRHGIRVLYPCSSLNPSRCSILPCMAPVKVPLVSNLLPACPGLHGTGLAQASSLSSALWRWTGW